MHATATIPHHGATDAGPEPVLDFSSNAHPLGPCPSAREALRAVDSTRYPDPSYGRLRDELGRFHDVHPDRIVVGAGAAELIHRIVRVQGGSVTHSRPGFGEYAHAARCSALPSRTFPSHDRIHPVPGTCFLCLPNNPDGHLPEGEELAVLADDCRKNEALLVLDLAYLPFLETPPRLPDSAVHLYAPNKAMGLVGVRAAYAIAPDDRLGRILSASAPSWTLGTEGEAFLAATIRSEALSWLRETVPEARRLRAFLAERLRESGYEVHESKATHMVARHPDHADSRKLAALWRSRGARVRDTASMGLDGWIRLAARPRSEIDHLTGDIGIPA